MSKVWLQVMLARTRRSPRMRTSEEARNPQEGPQEKPDEASDQDWGADLPSADLPKARPVRLFRPALVGVALLLGCAGFILMFSDRSGATAPSEARSALATQVPSPGPAAEPASGGPQLKPSFISIVRPLHLFALEAPELVKAAANYDAVRARGADGRRDDLSFGSAARADAVYLRLSVYRTGQETAGPAGVPSSLFVDLTRQAASVGLSLAKLTAGAPMPTKFGEMETADIKLQTQAVERPCLAFRRAVPGETLRLLGWYCAPQASFAGRNGLGCLIDRLALLSAGEDHALRDAFVAAEKRRGSCGHSGLVATASASEPWSVDANSPRFRGIKTN